MANVDGDINFNSGNAERQPDRGGTRFSFTGVNANVGNFLSGNASESADDSDRDRGLVAETEHRIGNQDVTSGNASAAADRGGESSSATDIDGNQNLRSGNAASRG